MQELEDTTLLEDFEDDFVDTTVPASTNEKDPYELDKDAHVARLAYLLKPLQDAANELYV